MSMNSLLERVRKPSSESRQMDAARAACAHGHHADRMSTTWAHHLVAAGKYRSADLPRIALIERHDALGGQDDEFASACTLDHTSDPEVLRRVRSFTSPDTRCACTLGAGHSAAGRSVRPIAVGGRAQNGQRCAPAGHHAHCPWLCIFKMRSKITETERAAISDDTIGASARNRRQRRRAQTAASFQHPPHPQRYSLRLTLRCYRGRQVFARNERAWMPAGEISIDFISRIDAHRRAIWRCASRRRMSPIKMRAQNIRAEGGHFHGCAAEPTVFGMIARAPEQSERLTAPRTSFLARKFMPELPVQKSMMGRESVRYRTSNNAGVQRIATAPA